MQKPFAFNLPAVTSKKAFSFWLPTLCFALFAFCLNACKFNPDTQGPGESYLQGEWQQDPSAVQKQLVNYSLYNFKFTCDSFFVSIKSYTRASTDSCIKNGQWSEYAKGVYDQKNDTLRLKGLFCNADMTYKVEGGCFRSGKYEEDFKVDKQADSVVQFHPTSSVMPFNLKLIQKNTCVPKPL